MRQLRALVPLLLILACAPTGFSATLPPVTANALDRQKVTLPEAFAAPLNVLILFFQRDQQGVVDGWLQVNSTAPAKVQTWLLPVSQRENELYRWWLNASLRGTQVSTLPRRYTVPLYVDKRSFLRALDIGSEQDVVVLLTDRGGNVLWRANGPVTDTRKAELASAIANAPPR